MINHGKAAVEKTATTTEKAGSKIVHGTSSVGAHSLRAALGLPTTPEQDDETAKSMAAYRKRAEQRRRNENVPAAVAPELADNQTSSIEVAAPPPANGGPVPQVTAATLGAVFQAVRQIWLSHGGDHPIVLDLNEISDLTGISADTVNHAIMRLERSGQIRSVGAGHLGLRRFEPV